MGDEHGGGGQLEKKAPAAARNLQKELSNLRSFMEGKRACVGDERRRGWADM